MDCTGYWNGGGEDQYSVDGGELQQQYSHPQILRWPPPVGPSTPGRSSLLPVKVGHMLSQNLPESNTKQFSKNWKVVFR